jgi:hypothetical protein
MSSVWARVDILQRVGLSRTPLVFEHAERLDTNVLSLSASDIPQRVGLTNVVRALKQSRKAGLRSV